MTLILFRRLNSPIAQILQYQGPDLLPYIPGCFQLTETFSVTRKTKASFPVSWDSFRRRAAILKLSFGTTKIAASANKTFIGFIIGFICELVDYMDRTNTVEPRYLELAYFELPLISKWKSSPCLNTKRWQQVTK